MAISDIYNSLTFGGVNSLDYGIYISGPGVFNAPTRAITFVDVPGRNGAIEIDEGHWNNIEVRYTAGTFGDDQSDFAQKINAFRNAIVSQIGYQRITDTYNPEEYRLGIYASGLSVNPENRNEAGEFELVFNCKPQRYLLEGEDEIAVTSGDAITNPTFYDAGPLIIAEGLGVINIGGKAINLAGGDVGPTEATTPIIQLSGTTVSVPILKEKFNIGDEIFIDNVRFRVVINPRLSSETFTSFEFRTSTNTKQQFYNIRNNRDLTVEVIGGGVSFNYGTPVSNNVQVFSSNFRVGVTAGGETTLISTSISVDYTYDGDSTITFNFNSATPTEEFVTVFREQEVPSLIGYSTAQALGGTTYIDTEIGDAYKIEDGQYIDLNKYIALPSDLPKLKPGENEITFDNTITDLKITPRWWEL